MTNSEEEVAHEDEPVLADQPVLGVLTGQVPVSGPLDKPSGTFVERMRKQVREGLTETGYKPTPEADDIESGSE